MVLQIHERTFLKIEFSHIGDIPVYDTHPYFQVMRLEFMWILHIGHIK